MDGQPRTATSTLTQLPNYVCRICSAVWSSRPFPPQTPLAFPPWCAGPVHDPCHYFHASLNTITLRRLWKPSPPSTPSSSAPTTSIHECQCRVMADTLQEFQLRAVNLYHVQRQRAQQPAIKVYTPGTGIVISVRKRSLPKGYTVPAQTLIVRFRKGDRRRSRQILFIKGEFIQCVHQG